MDETPLLRAAFCLALASASNNLEERLRFLLEANANVSEELGRIKLLVDQKINERAS